MTIDVGCHLDRGVAEAGLHDFERQFEPAIDPPVDAPGRIEVPETVEAGIFGAALTVDHAPGDLCWLKAAFDDAVAMLDGPAAVRKHDILFVPWAGEAVLAQR